MRTLSASTSAPDVGLRAEAASRGRIGPNAAIQLIAALRASGETAALARLLREAGHEDWAEAPPQQMIAARDAARLHVGLRALLPRERAEAALAEAGRLTGAYLLAHRIPAPAQAVLKRAPARLAAWTLLRAISAHAWTFAGDGRFESRCAAEAEARIYDNPLCAGLRSSTPACVWHAAVLQTLFAALVAPQARAEEMECRASGGDCCRFRIWWRAEN